MPDGCLTTDLLEEEASSAAIKIVGTEREFERKYGELRENLYSKLTGVLRSFVARNPMPLHYVCIAIQSLLEDGTDDLPEEYFVPRHFEQARAKTAEVMPQTLRHYGFNDLADLFEPAHQEFKRLKEEGERFLIGKTYQEQCEQSLNQVLGNPHE